MLVELAARLSLPALWFAPEWVSLNLPQPGRPWRELFAVTTHERLRLRSIVDATILCLFGLGCSEVLWVFRDCDYPLHKSLGSIKSSFDSKGFWRVDKDMPPEHRQTVLTQIAFYDIEEKIREHGGHRQAGIEAFLTQNNGEGWMLPETARLADYDLGHDERALERQPVASRLGPRFYDWQLTQSAEESWRECHLHARNLLGEAGYQNLLAEIEAERSGQKVVSPPLPVADIPLRDDQQLHLFS
jgi:hypothetical protein